MVRASALIAENQVCKTGYLGGVSLFVGDLNADGLADVRAVTIPAGLPVIQVIDGKVDLAARARPSTDSQLAAPEALGLILSLTFGRAMQ